MECGKNMCITDKKIVFSLMENEGIKNRLHEIEKLLFSVENEIDKNRTIVKSHIMNAIKSIQFAGRNLPT